MNYEDQLDKILDRSFKGSYGSDGYISAKMDIQAMLVEAEKRGALNLLDNIKSNESLKPKFLTKDIEQIMVVNATDDLGLTVQKAFVSGQNKTLALVDSYRYSLDSLTKSKGVK